MEEYTILIIIFTIVILFLLFMVSLVNNLLLKRNRVEFQLNSVIEYLEDRVMLLNRILNYVEKNASNEEKYILDIKKSIEVLNKIKTNSSIKDIKDTDKIIKKFVNLVEVYPKLKKYNEYQKINEEINLNNERISYVMESYDKEAVKYNKIKSKKINTIISKFFKIKDYEYYNK